MFRVAGFRKRIKGSGSATCENGSFQVAARVRVASGCRPLTFSDPTGNKMLAATKAVGLVVVPICRVKKANHLVGDKDWRVAAKGSFT
jgi:hypothetical protein